MNLNLIKPNCLQIFEQNYNKVMLPISIYLIPNLAVIYLTISLLLGIILFIPAFIVWMIVLQRKTYKAYKNNSEKTNL